MTEQAAKLAPQPEGYADWLADLKTRTHTAQQRAALAVNWCCYIGRSDAISWRGGARKSSSGCRRTCALPFRR